MKGQGRGWKMSDGNGMKEKPEVTSSWNIPNALTVLRLVLVPLFLWLLLMNTTESRWWAVAVFAVASYTDHLDGYLARKYNIITNFGKLADPLADKFLTLGAFIALSSLGYLSWWFTAIVAVREIGITVLREVLRRRGTVVAASSGGKLKTVLQILLIFALVIPWASFVTGDILLEVLKYFILIVEFVVLVITVWSGAQYVIASAKAMQMQKETE